MDDSRNLPFPRTGLAVDAMRFTRSITEPAIFNHSMRTYLYGRFLGEVQGMLPDRDYDDELLFLGCVLHDAGLSAPGNGDQRFELDGADLAATWLTERGLAPEKVEIVWDAVALHLCFEIAMRKRPEIALVTAGAGYDLGGGGPDLPAGYADRVHAALPRRGSAARRDRGPGARQAAQGTAVHRAGRAGPADDRRSLAHLARAHGGVRVERLRRLPGRA
jgi:hypothetical protein